MSPSSVQSGANAVLTPGPTLRSWPIESVILAHLLEQHPRHPRMDELAVEVEGFEADDLERAVENLSAAQLVRSDNSGLAPEAAVIAFDRERDA